MGGDTSHSGGPTVAAPEWTHRRGRVVRSCHRYSAASKGCEARLHGWRTLAARMPQLEHIDAIERRLWSAADTLRANSKYAGNE